MAFDFTKIIEQETKKQQEAGNVGGGNNLGFKTLYPFGNGRFELKFIGNEPSGTLYRELIFHEYYQGKNKMKTPCLHGMYGMECPICSAVNNVQDKLSDETIFRKYGFKKQGIMFAKLLGFAPENYFGESKNPPKVGDIVLFMFPKSVISELRNLIVEFADEVEDLFTNNITRTVTLKIGTQSNGFPEYTFYVKGNSTPLIVNDAGDPDDKGFAEFMKNMPNLNEVRFPAQVTEDIINVHRTLVEQINNEYFGIAPTMDAEPKPMSQVNTNTPINNIVPQTVITSESKVNTSIENKDDDSMIEAPPKDAVYTSDVSENKNSDSKGERPACFGDNKYNEECSKCPWDSECI